VNAPRGLIWQGLGVLAAAAFCVSLGFWQLRRLEWKERLIATIETRAQAPLVALPPESLWAGLRADDYNYRHVRAQGRFDLTHVALVFTPAPEGAGASVEPGFFALMPLLLDAGGVVIVNRGFTPQSKAGAGPWRAAPSGETVVEGWLHPPQGRNPFTPADDPARGKWFTADPKKIAGAFGLDDAAPFLLEQGAGGAAPDGLHRPGVVDTAQIVNNHLGYAVTWFGLALALALFFAVYAKTRLT
jgi:surfeit locus 1 family protein